MNVWHGLSEVIVLGEPISKRLALTIVHFLWQGVAVSIALGLVLRLLGSASARGRYIAACCALISLPLAAGLTFSMLEADAAQPRTTSMQPAAIDSNAIVTNTAGDREGVGVAVETLDRPPAAVPSPATRPSNEVREVPPAADLLSDAVNSPLPWLSAVSWLVTFAYGSGVLLMLTRTMISVIRSWKLRLRAEPCADNAIRRLVVNLAQRMGLRTAPIVLTCGRIVTPAVCGVVRPMILLPASLATTLTTDELSAVLTHELAHIRRHDLLVNLIQRVVESMLFFHPATWWISRMVSVERENCCDDLTVAQGVGRLEYVAALLRVAELCRPAQHLAWRKELVALSADGGDASQLARRIERLLGAPSPPSSSVSRVLSVVVLLSLFSATLWAGAAQTPLGGQAGENRTTEGHRGGRSPKESKETPQAKKSSRESKGASTEAENIRWGKAVDGLQLGVRPAPMTKHGSRLRIGNLLDYEIWIRNTSTRTIHIPRDPLRREAMGRTDRDINLMGGAIISSFAIDPKEFDKATLSVGPNEAKNLILQRSVRALIKSSDAPKGKGHEPLRLEPGKYHVFADGSIIYHVGDVANPKIRNSRVANLESPKVEIDIRPAPRLQLRRITELSSKVDREYVAGDRGLRLASWTPHQGATRDVIVNEHEPLLLDEDDILAFHGFNRTNLGNSSLRVSLTAAAAKRFANKTAWMSQPRDPNVSLGVLLDGKLISVRSLTQAIEGPFPVIPLAFTDRGVKAFEGFLDESMFRCPCQIAWSNTASGLRVGTRVLPAEDASDVIVEYLIRNASPETVTVQWRGNRTTLHKGESGALDRVAVSWSGKLDGAFRVMPQLIGKPDGTLQIRTQLTRRRKSVLLADIELPRLDPILLVDVTDADLMEEGMTDADPESSSPADQGDDPKDPNSAAPEDPEAMMAPTKPAQSFADRLNVRDLIISRRGDTIVSVATEKGVSIRTWNVETGLLQREVQLDTDVHGNFFLMSQLKMTEDGRRLITIVQGELLVWDTATGKKLTTLSASKEQGRPLGNRVLATAMNGNLVAAADQLAFSGIARTYDCDVLVWETEGNRLLARLTHPDAVQITSVAISPDGRWLASGSQNALTCIFDLQQDGKLVHQIKNENPGEKHPDAKVDNDSVHQVVCLAFSPDGETLALGDLLGVKLIQTASGRITERFKKPFRFGRSGLTFSSDGRFLARVATDKTTPIWALESGALVAELPTESHSGKFSRDGRAFVTGFTDRKQALTLWRLPKSFAARPIKQEPPRGLGFLAPYPQLEGLSLGMSKDDFRQLAKRKGLTVREAEDKQSFSIPMKDGHTVVVMFGGSSDRCNGIQRLRGR